MSKISSSTENLRRGQGSFLFDPNYTGTYKRLGNIPDFSITIEETKEDHYSSEADERVVDLSEVVETKVTATFNLEEWTPENLGYAFRGDGVQEGTQTGGAWIGTVAVDGQTTPVDDKYMDLNNRELSYTKLTVSSQSGSFTVAEQVTSDGAGTPTANVAWDYGNGTVLVVNESAELGVGDTITGGTSTETAVIESREVVNGIVVLNSAETAIYESGTDYDCIYQGGAFRKLSTGSITGDVELFYDFPAKTVDAVRALAATTIEGMLWFIGTNKVGPKWHVYGWKVQLSIGGAVNLISAERSPIPMTATFMADTSVHPNEPYFRCEEIY